MSMFHLDPNLVLEPFDAPDALSALRFMASRLVALGYVKESYPEAVVQREQEFPTGLPTAGAGVAIPHCDAEHVITPTIAVCTLVHPVSFGVMGSEDDQVSVEIIIMLALNDPSEQLDTLKRVATMVENPDVLTALKSAGSQGAVIRLLSTYFSPGNEPEGGEF